MATKLNMVRDINGYNTFGLVNSDTGVRTTLAAGVEQTTTVPSNTCMGNSLPLVNSSIGAVLPTPTPDQWLAIFSFEPGAKVWVDTITVTVPTGSFASSTATLNPASWLVNAGTVLHFITNNTTAEIGVKYYAISK